MTGKRPVNNAGNAPVWWRRGGGHDANYVARMDRWEIQAGRKGDEADRWPAEVITVRRPVGATGRRICTQLDVRITTSPAPCFPWGRSRLARHGRSSEPLRTVRCPHARSLRQISYPEESGKSTTRRLRRQKTNLLNSLVKTSFWSSRLCLTGHTVRRPHKNERASGALDYPCPHLLTARAMTHHRTSPTPAHHLGRTSASWRRCATRRNANQPTLHPPSLFGTYMEQGHRGY